MSRGDSSRTLSIVIAGDAKGAQRAMGQTSVAVDDLSSKIRSSAVDVARAWATFQGARFLRDATESAASLSASQETVDATFAQSAATMRSFAEDSVDALGLSEQAALSWSANLGMLFQGFDIGTAKAAEMSQRILDLAADMAAARDVTVDEAAQALFSGLSGEAEPLKRFGVVINEATIRAKALEMGLYSGTGALDQQTKAVATYNLILERTSLMHGAWERESDGLLASQQKLTAEWENAKAKLGEELVPAMQAAVGVSTEMLDVWGALPGSVQLGAVALAGMAAWGPELASGFRAARGQLDNFRLGAQGVAHSGAGVANALGSMTTAAGRAGAETSAMNRAMAATPRSFGAINTAALGTAAALGSYALTMAALEASADRQKVSTDAERLAIALDHLARTGEARGELEAYGSGLEDLAAAIDTVDKSTGRLVWEALAPGGTEITDMKGARDTLEELDEALAAQAKRDPDEAAAAYIAIVNALREQGLTTEQIVPYFSQYWQAQEDGALAAETSTAATEDNTAAREENANAAEKQEQALRDKVDATRRELDLERGVTDATRGLADAQAELDDARRAAATGSEEHQALLRDEADAAKAITDAQEGVTEALRGVRDAEAAVAEAKRGARDAEVDLNDARRTARERIEEMAQAAREAVLDERGSELAVRQAAENLRDVLRNTSSSDLEKDQARHEYDQAVAARDAARDETSQAQQAAADAQRAGVEGTPEVLAAKEQLRQAELRIVDAQEGVIDAQRRVVSSNEQVQDAQRRLAETKKRTSDEMAAASKRVEDAERKVGDATFDVADAYYNLKSATGSAEDAIKTYRAVLARLAGDLAPGSELRKNLYAFANDIDAIRTGNGHTWGDPFGVERQRDVWGDPFNTNRPTWEDPFGVAGRSSTLPEPSPPPVGGKASARPGAGTPTVHQTVNVYGTDVQTRRETQRVITRALDDAAKGLTGG